MIYSTKYFLVNGIIAHDNFRRIDDDPEMIEILPTGPGTYSYYLHKPDWHETMDEAKARGLVVLEKKIASVEKQLVRLKKLSKECKAGMFQIQTTIAEQETP